MVQTTSTAGEIVFEDLVSEQREFFNSGRTSDIDFRLEQLGVFKKAVYENRRHILRSLKEDLGKPTFEAYVAEVSHVMADIDHAAKRVSGWARPRRAWSPSFLFPASSYVYPEPLGVVLIISPWNYPVDLALTPLVGAIAAGNCAVIKPSEITPSTSKTLAKIIGENFDPSYVTVVEGDASTAQALLNERFDFIMYTGGGSIGRSVMAAAARNLTPVTLELGGKSPCIVEPDIDLEHAARRITWGKYFNAGQTCIAPDYLLVNSAIKDKLLEAIRRQIHSFYGDDPSKSEDYARIVSDRHFERVSALLSMGNIVVGGDSDRSSRYVGPTVMDGVSPDDAIMQEEIFGPVLPVIEYGELDEAIAFANSRPKPLALYFFSRDKAKQDRVLSGTTSGGCCFNDVMLHFSNNRLPFGGVGESGFGKYHGKYTFDMFSNMKAVVRKSFSLDVFIRYPPYKNAQKLAQRLLRFVT